MLFKKMENLFENLVWVLRNILKMFVWFVFEYLGCLIFLRRLLDDSKCHLVFIFFIIICLFYFCTELTALYRYGQPNL